MATAIKVENISKAYQLGSIGTGTISRDIGRWWTTNILGKEDPFLKIGETNDRSTRGKSDIVWSLKDINFDIEQGAAVGIIGKNGAGKSTLLKLLSRVTAPTIGTIKVKGRVASLLEVGTGFHPELTGRENIYLNGAILGMRKAEIKRKMEEIVNFSGVERYIDTPVKRYSSGMYVRLAFAVAAHLESEILIVDEVLAVGDAAFQKKCLGKMGEVSQGEGRTVLFVSHNMAAVKSLCKEGIVLSNGQTSYIGNAEQAISCYISDGTEYSNKRIFGTTQNNNTFSLHEISLTALGKDEEAPLTEYDTITLRTKISVHSDAERLQLTYVLGSGDGQALFTFSHINSGLQLKRGLNVIECTFPKGYLNIGSYHLNAYIIIDQKETIFNENDIHTFSVQEGERPIGSWMGKEPGFIKPQFQWTLL